MRAKKLTPGQAKTKAAKYCAYQERSQQQVRDKLYEYGLYSDEVEEIIAWLITENFINEERFASSYARGKFNLKHWGKVKIRIGLKQHQISDYCINKALKEINTEDYLLTLNQLIEKKQAQLGSINPFEKKQKIARYLIGKGFESELVWESLQDQT